MGIYNKDEVKGKIEQGKGWVKDKAGEITGNRDLEAEGEADRVAGETREGWGKVKRGVSETLDDISDRINS
ncbi:MAG: CsbD family protein [Pyrinomonadaceae bacterium]|nr:CsbD family protein [Pyrinomonadaceae bacterium]